MSPQRHPPSHLPIYLDYAATTPVDPRVVEVMLKFLSPRGVFGNPASRSHSFGHEAAKAVELARERVAALINAQPHEIIWTSGATEATNLALKGAARAHQKRGNHIITSKLEHKAVLDTCAALEREGFEITYLAPDSKGLITPAIVRAALRPKTVLVSLMYVNNEVGTITDIGAIGALVRAHGALFHVDAVQGVSRLPFDVGAQSIDLASISGHKMYAPKGVGVLYVRHRPQVALCPLIHGGGHERGFRSGTLATHQIAAMGEAAHLIATEREKDSARIAQLEQKFLSGLENLPNSGINGDKGRKAKGILNLHFDGVLSESLMAMCRNLAFSSGSACTSTSLEPSHVLESLGIGEDLAECSIRISIGRFTTKEEVDFALREIKSSIHDLRQVAN